MDVIDVEGATGTVTTNFDGKAKAAIDALKNGADFVYVHLEAPDEAGHRHEIENKVKAIELIDQKIVAPIVGYLKDSGEDYAILIMPDHPTPLAIRTHTSDPIPYVLYNSKTGKTTADEVVYCEKEAKKTGIFIKDGYKLINKLLEK